MLSFFTLLSKTDQSVNHEDLLFSLITLSVWFSHFYEHLSKLWLMGDNTSGSLSRGLSLTPIPFTGLVKATIPSSSPTNLEPTSGAHSHPLAGMCSVKPPPRPLTQQLLHCLRAKTGTSQPREDSHSSHAELDPCSPVLHLPLPMVCLLTWTSPGSCLALQDWIQLSRFSWVWAQMKQRSTRAQLPPFCYALHQHSLSPKG